MSWNYRIIKHDENEEEYFSIHEVYYDEEFKPIMCTEKPINLGLNEYDDLKYKVDKIQEAFNHPILNFKDF